VSATSICLKEVANRSLATPLVRRRSGWGGFSVPAKGLDGLPTGRQVFARVPFVLPPADAEYGMLVLAPEDREERTIPVSGQWAAVYLLHTMERGEMGRTPVVYTFRYEDGSSAEREVTVGEDVGDWLFPKEFSNCIIGWTGYLSANEYQKSVYVAELVNPHPEKRLAGLSVRRRDWYGTYVLLGVTASSEPPFFASARKGSPAGLADYVELPCEIFQVRNGFLDISACVRTARGEMVRDADVTAVIAGHRHPLSLEGDSYRVSVPAEKGWRKYANALSVEATLPSGTVCRKDAIFYAHGYPRLMTPPHGKRPPQFICIAFDDCKSLPGVEAMLEIIENLRRKNARVVFVMYTSPAPSRSADLEKVKLLYKRMYDLGCEFANHTLNHNPGGVNWFALDYEGQVREIEGCRDWFRENIPGVWYVYSQKSGGGGKAGFRDPKFTRRLMKRQKFEYNVNNVTARYDTAFAHPDIQMWPCKLGDEWAIDIGLVDANAPPVHTPITKGFFSDYSGKFDMPVEDGIRMLVANFEYRYNLPNRPPFIINAFHEWGLGNYYWSHRNEKAILEGFLTEVLVTQRRRFPETRCITFHELIEYMKRGNIDEIIAEGNQQGKKRREPAIRR